MVLITGSTGFVGKHLVRFLLKQNIPVRVLLRPNSNSLALKDLPVEKVQGNPFNPDSLKTALDGVDTIIHCAGALVGTNYNAYYKGNVLYTENLVKAAKQFAPQLKKFIFISSQAAAGPSDSDHPKKETELATPVSVYGKTKLLAERSLIQSGLPYIILRPSSIYGPEDHEFFPLFKMTQKGIQAFVGNGQNKVNLLFIDDFIEAIYRAFQSPLTDRVFFVSGEGEFNWRQILEFARLAVNRKIIKVRIPKFITWLLGNFNTMLGKIIGKPFLLSRDKVKEMLQPYWIFDTHAIKNELHFTPRYSPKEGFELTYLWYKKAGWL